MPSQLHNYRIVHRRDEPSAFTAHCTCGWTALANSYERVSFLAAGHDLDFESYPPAGQFEIGAMWRDRR